MTMVRKASWSPLRKRKKQRSRLLPKSLRRKFLPRRNLPRRKTAVLNLNHVLCILLLGVWYGAFAHAEPPFVLSERSGKFFFQFRKFDKITLQLNRKTCFKNFDKPKPKHFLFYLPALHEQVCDKLHKKKAHLKLLISKN